MSEEIENQSPKAIIGLDAAGDVVTELVKANARVILSSVRLGRERQRDSRNALSESVFSHYQLVSMLAVAVDRLAVFEALTPTPDVERAADKLELALRNLCPETTLPSREAVEQMARAVLDR